MVNEQSVTQWDAGESESSQPWITPEHKMLFHRYGQKW